MSHLYGIGAAEQPFVDAAIAIAKEVAGPAAADVDAKARFPKEAVAAFQAKGLGGLTVGVDAGGKGQGPRAFCAEVVSPVSFETGIQKIERDPFSEKASVVRWRPAAISRRMPLRLPKVLDAAMAIVAETCIV